MNRNWPRSAEALMALALALLLPQRVLKADEFAQTNLVSNVPGLAKTTDPNLTNPWGVAFGATSPFWISNQGSGTSTLYDGAGNIVPLVVNIPPGTPPATGPTGQVFNGTTDFVLPNGKASAFIFDTLNGTLAGWNGSAGTNAVQVSSTPGALYTGLALASSGGSNFLYAADATGQIRVFNSTFQQISLPGHFTDPNAQAGFVPFNIQLIGSSLYVTYAQLTPQGEGLPGGYIDVFNTDGTFVQRLATGGPLNAPWGVTLAPSTFGSFGNDLLVGNFGNGEILAYSQSGTFLGTLNGVNGQPIVNDNLWALEFRAGGTNNDPNALYFTAGIGGEQNGLFGDLTVATPEPTLAAPVVLGLLGIVLFNRRRTNLRNAK